MNTCNACPGSISSGSVAFTLRHLLLVSKIPWVENHVSWLWTMIIWLVVATPLTNMKVNGMMIISNIWKNKKMFQSPPTRSASQWCYSANFGLRFRIGFLMKNTPILLGGCTSPASFHVFPNLFVGCDEIDLQICAYIIFERFETRTHLAL